MIDTLNFTLAKTHYDYEHVKHIFEKRMKFKVDSTYSNGTALVFGYKNYTFRLTQHHLIAHGSLTKLYCGDNVQNLSFDQVQDALMEFETLFGVPFDKAIINRVDIALCSIMNQLPKVYIDILQTPSGFEPDIRRTGKTFTHHAKVICIYDAVENLKKERSQREIYNQFKGQNILKYELRFGRLLLTTLAEGEITFDRLYSHEFYKILLTEWYNQYCNIPKLTIPYASQLNYTSLRVFKESLLKVGINAVGGIEVLNADLKLIKMPKFVRAAIRRYLQSLPKLEPLSPILQKELDDKISTAYENIMFELQQAA